MHSIVIDCLWYGKCQTNIHLSFSLLFICSICRCQPLLRETAKRCLTYHCTSKCKQSVFVNVVPGVGCECVRAFVCGTTLSVDHPTASVPCLCRRASNVVYVPDLISVRRFPVFVFAPSGRFCGRVRRVLHRYGHRFVRSPGGRLAGGGANGTTMTV